MWKPVPELISILGVDVPQPPDVSLAGIRPDAATVNWTRPSPNRPVQKFLIQVNGVVGEHDPLSRSPRTYLSILYPQGRCEKKRKKRCENLTALNSGRGCCQPRTGHCRQRSEAESLLQRTSYRCGFEQLPSRQSRHPPTNLWARRPPPTRQCKAPIQFPRRPATELDARRSSRGEWRS